MRKISSRGLLGFAPGIGLPSTIVMPSACKAQSWRSISSVPWCSDVLGFIDYIFPRLALLGAGMLILGALFLVNMLVIKIDAIWVNVLSIVLPLALFAWYIVVQRKAAKRFW